MSPQGPSSQPWNAICPVCSALPLDELPGGTDTLLEYSIDLGLKFREELKVWESCILAKLVRDLSRYWSGEVDASFYIENKGYSWYHFTCSRNTWYLGDPGTYNYVSVDYG